MNKPVCYLFIVLIYDVFLLSASEFYPIDFLVPLLALLFLAESKFKVLTWLLTLNIFVFFIVFSYILNGDFVSAKIVFIRTNLILLLVLSLFLGKNQYFLIKALYSIKIPQKLLAVMIINSKLFEELLNQISKIPNTLKVRGVKVNFSIFTYRAYANLIGKIIVNGFDRSFEIYSAMRVRGYKGYISFLDMQRANLSEISLLILTLIAAGFRIYKFVG